MAAAADTLSEPILPRIGMLLRKSQLLATSGLTPGPSPPRTRQIGPERSISHGACPPLTTAPAIHTPSFLRISITCTRFVSRATGRYSTAPMADLAAAAVTPAA